MKRLHTDQRGIAAVEAALGMLVLVPLLLVLVEASRALMEYSQLQNAAMEGARMVSRQNGDDSGVADYINSLFLNADSSSTVDGAAPTVSISPRTTDNNVTVQVDHVFSPFFTSQSDAQGGSSLFGLMGSTPLTLSAKVVMALPAAN
ncbi:TadE/TadG family type IV pilus assembly protein [Solidesulfovibrio sp.]